MPEVKSNELYYGKPTNFELLDNLLVVSSGSTVRYSVITKSRLMSNYDRVTVTNKLGQLFQIMTDFQSEQLGYDRSENRTCDLKKQKNADYNYAPPLSSFRIPKSTNLPIAFFLVWFTTMITKIKNNSDKKQQLQKTIVTKIDNDKKKQQRQK